MMEKYIDREYAFKELNDQCKITGYGGITPYDLKKVFERLPDADVRENVHARWIDTGEGDNTHKICSNCGTEHFPLMRDRFCSVCGARMDGEETQ